MQKLLLFGLMALLLTACGGSNSTADQAAGAETAAAIEEAPDVKTTGFSVADISGFYRGSTWHSQGYVVIIEQQNGKWMVRAAETEGGEPTMKDIEDYPDFYPLEAFTTFELNEDRTAFDSDWGKGKFEQSEYGFRMIFERLIGSYDPGDDKNDIEVKLTKIVED